LDNKGAIMKFRPLQDRLLIKRIENEEKTAGGIIIPDSAKEKPQEGEVVAVGNGKRLDDGTQVALDLKKGDRVLFGKYSGSEIKLDGIEHLILREDEILGVLE
tara:strand:+ start:127 stop:435 length:309 start_codon:yes stop_codon:yes gene_type:complete